MNKYRFKNSFESSSRSKLSTSLKFGDDVRWTMIGSSVKYVGCGSCIGIGWRAVDSIVEMDFHFKYFCEWFSLWLKVCISKYETNCLTICN